MDPLAYAPEFVVLAAALLVFLADVLGVRRLEAFGGIATGASAVAFALVLADLGTPVLSGLSTLPAGVLDAPLGPGITSFTSLGLVFQAIFLLAAFFVSLASLSRPSAEAGSAVFFGLLLLATLGMLLVALSADLIFLLLAIELASISTYLMVGYSRKEARHLEAAMKFYIIGALSTALSFFGASLLFGAYGGTSFYGLGPAATPIGYPTLALVGYALLIAGLGFKVTAVPFHAWAVDVYDGAPTDVSAFLAGGTKKMGIFAFFLVFLAPLLILGHTPALGPRGFASALQLTLGIAAVLTMTVGNLLALLQKEMKRLLAYSSISQAGYMLIGVAVASGPAVAGATFQVLAHVFMKTGAFLVVAAVASLGVGPLIEDWRGLGPRRPYLSLSFALMLLSLAGVPLTIGFVSKFVLFSSAVQAKGPFVWLAVAGLLNSALSVFYYARILKTIYLDPPAPTDAPAAVPAPAAGIGWGRGAAILLITVGIVALGIYPGPVLSGIQAAASQFVFVGG
ncbi:MAG: NADH-quinone oxidoreductase subunit N [Thermoplasmata archaeon]|nr:NADH-quinone oxidoreductase subunit N [Thermoplasmata archaeon]MCI4359007.1 NADH-quinone oxidoreductase subunit N [Thermoplasmata archaeon]